MKLTWNDVIDELLRLRKLEDNWDGHGAPKPNKDAIDYAIIFADYLRQDNAKPPVDFYLSNDCGYITMEWNKKKGFVLIDIFGDGRGRYSYYSYSGRLKKQIVFQILKKKNDLEL